MTKTCPTCERDLPIDEFGICRARKDGRNLYCKRCIRKKVNESRAALRAYRLARKQVLLKQEAPQVSLPFAMPQIVRVKLSPVEKVREAIRKNARTQKEIQHETKLGKDEIGDALALLLLISREIRTEVVGNMRMYFMNESEMEVSRKPSLPTSFSAVRGLGPVMKGEKKVKGWVAA